VLLKDTTTGGGAVSEDKRALGSYYSPEPYARALVQWALNGRIGSVTDPSYGGCAILRVAIEQLTELGAERPTELVFGSDVDDGTAQWAAHLISKGVPREHLRSADFLSLTPGVDLPLTRAVVGNPPYVRHHRLTASARTRAVAAAAAAGVALSGRASLWAYFVVHAARFVQPGGRMALLLPGAVMQVDYAPVLLDHLEERFEDVLLVRVRERIFPDAGEETVVLLASGARAVGKPSRRRYADVNDLADLLQLLARPTAPAPRAEPVMDGVSDWKRRLLPPGCLDILTKVLAAAETRRLGDVARISLGTVTGANATFVLTDDQADRLAVRAHTVPVVTRSASLTGPVLCHAGFNGWQRRLLTLPADFPLDRRTRLGRYLTAAEAEGVHERHHCRREPWWALGEVAVPDAFLAYMMAAPRGIALNGASASSTNTVHQVQWRVRPSVEQERSWAVTSWSSLGQVCAELYGRHYGGGVLKLELAAARQLPVLDLAISETAWRTCQRDGDRAQQVADAALLGMGLGLTVADLQVLNDAAATLSASRAGRPREMATAIAEGSEWGDAALA
jgi:adenine-specific DNA-methyltransferase